MFKPKIHLQIPKVLFSMAKCLFVPSSISVLENIFLTFPMEQLSFLKPSQGARPPTAGTSITTVPGGANPAEEHKKSEKRPLRISKQRPKLPAPRKQHLD